MDERGKMKPQKFRPFLMIPLGVVLGLLIAGALFIYHVNNILLFNPNGWMTVYGIGSEDADIFTRAIIAKIGIFANSKDTAVYLIAVPDADLDCSRIPNPKNWFSLSADKHFRIKGNINIPATWWSITLYNKENLLVKNPQNRYSFTNFNLVTDKDGNFTIDVASRKPAGATNWLPSPHNGLFNLKMRIFEPTEEVYKNIATYPLPKVKEVVEQ